MPKITGDIRKALSGMTLTMALALIVAFFVGYLVSRHTNLSVLSDAGVETIAAIVITLIIVAAVLAGIFTRMKVGRH